MTERLEIWGGRPLYGTVEIPSAKNSVLPLLAATVLCQETVYLEKVPRLSDVDASLQMLRALNGMARCREETVTVSMGKQIKSVLPAELMQKMRASVLFLAPVLARTGSVEASLPGGCRLGARPIDIHLDGLTQMGAVVHWHEDRIYLRAPHGLSGTKYTMRYPSVGATETLLLAAVCAKGQTVLYGAAREPEVQDLAKMLNACGGHITGAGTDTIRIDGVPALSGCRYTPIPDRITAATVACACAAAGGCVKIRGIDAALLKPVLDALQDAGCQIRRQEKEIQIQRHGTLHGIGMIKTGVYPEFPTDAAPLLAAALLFADSESCIEDTVFSNRFACADGFAAMGANVCRVKNTLQIRPCSALWGAHMEAQDLRGGAALVIAALGACGTSEISNIFYLKRGYPSLNQLLRGLGAGIHVKKR